MLLLKTKNEARQTTEARFAAALDRIEPILQNYMTQGFAWKKLRVSYPKVYSTNEHIKEGSEKLWEYIEGVLQDALEKDYFGE